MGSESEKRRLRRLLAARRREVPPAMARAAGVALSRRMASTPEFIAARRVALYVSLPDELPTEPLFEECRRIGKRVMAPRIVSDRLEFAAIAGLDELRPGRYGIAEPHPGVPAERMGARDLVFVPGVAFDLHGNRLGRGGGFYDRAFGGEGPLPVRFGVAYAFQLIEHVPHGPEDGRVDAIVTEQGIYRIASELENDESA